MRKNLFVIVSILLAFVEVEAQNDVYDSTRVYDVVTDTNSYYYFSTPKPCIKPRQEKFMGGFSPLVQQYVTNDTLTIYGVALTICNGNDNYNPFFYSQHRIHAVLNSMHGRMSGPNLGYDYIMHTDDTVTFNRAHPRFCWFVYEDGCNVEKSMQVPCYELYFDTPDRINTVTDTFYVGFQWDFDNIPWYLINFYGGGFDNSLPGTMYGAALDIGNTPDDDLVGDTAYMHLNYANEKLWGVAFPIIGFRCGPMDAYWLDSLAVDSAVVRWRRVEQETLFNVRLVGSDGSDTTYITSDTSLVLTQQSDSVRYNVMLRKQCRYATSNYDTTVYGQWLSYISFGRGRIDTTGTNDDPAGIAPVVQREDFVLVPNPARAGTRVLLPPTALGGRLSVLDVDGREWHSRTVASTTEALDTSMLPAGVYLVRLTTDNDVVTHRLLIAGD